MKLALRSAAIAAWLLVFHFWAMYQHGPWGLIPGVVFGFSVGVVAVFAAREEY